MRNSSEPTSVSIFLTSSTSSSLASGRMISMRLLPILRIGVSLTPCGSARCFNAEISSSMLKLAAEVLPCDLVDEDRPTREVDPQLQLLVGGDHGEQAKRHRCDDQNDLPARLFHGRSSSPACHRQPRPAAGIHGCVGPWLAGTACKWFVSCVRSLRKSTRPTAFRLK